ncbi:hypothetical protein GCM10010492_67180 [Saccharothrix mutabilis subsp. mutabilis]|uniref:Uncharacterized protein n=1 Tax=Saccharothrix mutabilis subsp. mutabilis TaxID=66855 RepID=A0ABP3EC06_9PSEU
MSPTKPKPTGPIARTIIKTPNVQAISRSRRGSGPPRTVASATTTPTTAAPASTQWLATNKGSRASRRSRRCGGRGSLSANAFAPNACANFIEP